MTDDRTTELQSLSKLKMTGKLHYWRGTIEMPEAELHAICDEIQVEHEQAIAATLGSGTCKNKATNMRTFWCDCCDCALEDWMDVGGKLVNGLRYCPNCGRKSVD